MPSPRFSAISPVRARGSSRRRLAVACALVLGTGLAGGSGATADSSSEVAAASAAVTEPSLSLRRSSESVVLPKYRHGVYLDIGAYLVAGDIPFEVRITRPPIAPYRHKVTARLVRPDAAGGDVVLPDRLVDGFGGLRAFTTTRVLDRQGRVVATRSSRFCASYDAVRVEPDGPDISAYPTNGCYGSNPFTLGAVHGLESGWAMPASAEYESRVRLATGRYKAVVRIADGYRRLFAIPRAHAVTRIGIRVVDRRNCEHCAAQRVGSPAALESRSGTGSPVPMRPARSEPAGTTAAAPAEALPDLRSVPAWGIGVTKGHFLAFGATVWNAGPSPLVVDGFRRQGEDVMDAYQYFYDADGEPHGHQLTGTMEWDERDGHHHWHFTDFARYRLLDADKQAVVRSKKEAFCLANTDVIDYTLPGANWQPEGTDLHSACGQQSSLAVREVLDVGSGDTYAQYRPGQSFNLRGLQPGIYYIEVTGNPLGNLAEVDHTNNTALRKVRIGGDADADRRRVKVFDVGLVRTR